MSLSPLVHTLEIQCLYRAHIGKYLGDLRKLNHVIVLKAGFEPQL